MFGATGAVLLGLTLLSSGQGKLRFQQSFFYNIDTLKTFLTVTFIDIKKIDQFYIRFL